MLLLRGGLSRDVVAAAHGGACGFGLESDPPSSGSFCNWEGLVVFGKSNSLTVHPMTMKALLKKIISFSPFKNYIYFDLFI